MKKALVLPGGGVKGAFQVGVLEYLIKEKGESYDIIVGTSVGAINGTYLAQYKKEDLKKGIDALKKLWRAIDNRDVKRHWKPFSFLHALWKQSLYNSKPLEEMIESNLCRHKLKSSGIELSVPAINLDSGERIHFREDSPHIIDAVKASAAFPVFFKPVEIDGDIYWDGSIKEVAPLLAAIQLGAEHITIINTGLLKSPGIKAKSKKTLALALRAIGLQGDEVIRNDLQHFLETNQRIRTGTLMHENKREITYEYYEPTKEPVSNPLNFDPDDIRYMIKMGNTVAKNKMK